MAIRMAKKDYSDMLESQYRGTDCRNMWQDLQSINNYKVRPAEIEETFIQISINIIEYYR